MPHPEPRVTALLNVDGRAAEPADQEIAEPLLGAGQIVRRIHRAQDVVSRDLRVECRHQPAEPAVTDQAVYISLVHVSII